jgi:two-component system NarL family response regulator
MRLLLADDHPLLRAGLRALLAGEPDLEIVGEAANGAQALLAMRTLAPDVAVLDLQMPGMSGLEVVQRYRPGAAAIVILTLSGEEADARAALDAGALAYVLKDDLTTDLVRAIHAAARGERHLSPRIAALLRGPR